MPFSSRSPYTSTVSSTFLNTLQTLVSNFPDRPRSNSLVVGFFEKDNWRFGLPQTPILSVYHSMWDTITTDERALERIDFNWVAFLFSIFALSSGCSSEQESRKYFLQALTAKRLAEDVQYASFFTPRDSGSFSQGTAHGCIAVALMAEYMCDRGQLTEVRTFRTRVHISNNSLGMEPCRFCCTQRSERRPAFGPCLEEMERHDKG